jgi:hypothetical protein
MDFFSKTILDILQLLYVPELLKILQLIFFKPSIMIKDNWKFLQPNILGFF